MSSADETYKKFLIPLEEIHSATKQFSSETLIGEGKSSKVYKGILSEPWQYRTVAIKHVKMLVGDEEQVYRSGHELAIAAFSNHANIIPFVGFSKPEDEEELFLVFEYAENGSLDNYLRNRDCRPTWEERLKICIGAAKGLEYLHSGFWDKNPFIHRDFKTANILLDKNLKAKICGFDFTTPLDQNNQEVEFAYKDAVGTLSYLDPVYYESDVINKESDVYSFGVVLYEMLSGMLVYKRKNIDNVHPQTLINLVRNCYDDGLEKLIDSSVRINLNMLSFKMFKKIAYECMSLKLDERPTMRMIVKRLSEALYMQNHGSAPSITRSQPDGRYRERFQIPVAEMKLAMEGFSLESRITHPLEDPISYLVVHRGQLSESWQNQKVVFKCYNQDDGVFFFHREVEMFHRFKHENIISMIGYCNHNDNYFLVQQNSENGSLSHHLYEYPDKKRWLTWAERLKICVGAARGLKYLHSGLGEHTRVIHGDVTSEMILLDDKFEAKISDFRFSVLVDTDEPQVYGAYVGLDYYRDPICSDNDMVRTESDVYSFGVVLFEVLTGMLAQEKRDIGNAPPQGLLDFVRSQHELESLDELVDLIIREEISNDSLQVFNKIASQCISLNPKDRPTMNRILSRLEEALEIHIKAEAASARRKELERHLIPLEEIKLATNNFSRDTWIGEGGFGTVYKGQLRNCTVAIKTLNTEGQQGYKEFDTELKLISSFRHDNIIPFVGYCNEDNHMIIVTEYATNHSLDHHLYDSTKRRSLTWAHRLKICLGAARGLNYLHSHGVIHRDIKSGNILLHKNMEARICDFGLSKLNLENDQQVTHIYTKAAGTNFYLDPCYHESGILRSASDVYSFGVVLFEILSGRLAYSTRSLADGKPQPPLINLVRRYQDDHQLETLVDPSIASQIDSRCLNTLQEIAYKCISLIPKERPTMDRIVKTIEDAMDFQLLKSIEARMKI